MNTFSTAARRGREHLIPALAVASLFLSCAVISARKYFWNDELYSYFLLSDSSFRHMLTAFHDKINNTPPLYFIMGWVWSHAFGSSELSLRMFSFLGISVALWLVWLTLRRTHGFWPANIGALAVFCTSKTILAQNAEARMYGLFMALCALALFLYERCCRDTELSRSLMIATVCTHAAIVNTHLFGAFYSAAFLLSLILRDRWFKVFRVKVYAAIVLSWLAILPYIPSFLNQSDAGRPRTWIPTPSVSDLTDFLSLADASLVSRSVFFLLILAGGLQFLLWRSGGDRQGRLNESPLNHETETSLLIIAYSLLALPVFIWVYSRAIKPIFWERYMIPSSLGWAILIAYAVSRLDFHAAPFRNGAGWQERLWTTFKLSALPSALVVLFLAQPLLFARDFRRGSIPGSSDRNFGYEDLPVVVQASAQFLERLHYAPDRDRYFFILDWDAALDKASGPFGPQEFKHMEAIKREYPDSYKQIVDSDTFLAGHDRFLVLDYLEFDKACPLTVHGLDYAMRWEGMHCPQWVERKLLNSPDYNVKSLGEIYGETLLLVEARK